jgi:hypothetical protein
MRKILATALLALMAGQAAAFATDLVVDVGELNIEAVAITDGRLAGVRVTNRETFPVRCSAVFRNGPETGRARGTEIASAETRTLTWIPQRQVVRMRIELRCEPAD